MNDSIQLVLAQAIQAHDRSDLIAADRLYGHVLDGDSGHFDALHLRGVAWHQLGRSAQGLALIEQALAIRPNDAMALANQALVLRAVGRKQDSLATYTEALKAAPHLSHVWANRGNVQRDLGYPAAAVSDYHEALRLQPGDHKAMHGLGLAQHALGEWSLAIAAFDRALQLVPVFADAWLDRGNALRELGDFEAALQSYDKAIAAQPEQAGAWSNRGVVLKRLGRLEEAAQSYERALRIKPDFLDAMVNYATTLKELLRLPEAMAMNRRALALDPANSGAWLNLAICQLLEGHFDEGFAAYEWRWKNAQMAGEARTFVQPQWAGEDIRGKTILLHAEQGLGDTLQFCRYVPWVKARGARVVLEVQPPLVPLLTALEWTDAVLARGSELPMFDVHCPLLSLPLAMGTNLSTIPLVSTPRFAYLGADPAYTQTWQQELERMEKSARPMRVGLVWSGRAEHKNDHNRSIVLQDLSALLDVASERGLVWHSLQKEFRANDLAFARERGGIALWNERLGSFQDTAALIACMDLVVSVDTSVAHLAAAMGKPVWLLLPHSPDWRWLPADGNFNRWYPTMRLWRQSAYGNWHSVVEQVAAALRAMH